MESGCLPMMFEAESEDVGCQADPPQCDDCDDNDSDNTSLDSEEEWCLEQIELAYKKLHRKGQLAEYEKRQGLKEVIAVYSSLCEQLQVEREDTDFDQKETVDQLTAYKPLMDKTLKLKISRESDIALLCTQIVEVWRSIGCEPVGSYYTEIIRVTKCKPRKSTLGTSSMLPRYSSTGGPPLLTPTEATINSLTECHSRLVEELQKAEDARRSPQPDIFSGIDPGEDRPPATHNDCILLWQSIEVKSAKLNLRGTHWEQTLKGIVTMSEEEPETGRGILEVGLENITLAESAHNDITVGLKTLSQDVALLDCHRQLSSSRFPSRVPRQRDDIDNIRKQVANQLTELITRLESFVSDTRGIPYIGPPVFSELLGLPTASNEIVAHLRCLQRQHPPTVARYSDASASI